MFDVGDLGEVDSLEPKMWMAEVQFPPVDGRILVVVLIDTERTEMNLPPQLVAPEKRRYK